MIRTQIYLSQEQRYALDKLAAGSKRKRSKLIRDAVDTMIAKLTSERGKAIPPRVPGS